MKMIVVNFITSTVGGFFMLSALQLCSRIILSGEFQTQCQECIEGSGVWLPSYSHRMEYKWFQGLWWWEK